MLVQHHPTLGCFSKHNATSRGRENAVKVARRKIGPSKDMSMSFSRTSSSDVALCLLKLPIVVCNKLATFENYVGWCWLEFKLAYIVQHCWLAASLASSEQAFTQTQRDVIVDVVDQPSFPKTWEQPCRQSKNCTHFRRFNYGNGWMKIIQWRLPILCCSTVAGGTVY